MDQADRPPPQPGPGLTPLVLTRASSPGQVLRVPLLASGHRPGVHMSTARAALLKAGLSWILAPQILLDVDLQVCPGSRRGSGPRVLSASICSTRTYIKEVPLLRVHGGAHLPDLLGPRADGRCGPAPGTAVLRCASPSLRSAAQLCAAPRLLHSHKTQVQVRT